MTGRNTNMLVLSRKVNERILIGDNVVVTIVRVHGNNVRLGIEAPPAVRVLRSELASKDQAAAVPRESEKPQGG